MLSDGIGLFSADAVIHLTAPMLNPLPQENLISGRLLPFKTPLCWAHRSLFAYPSLY